MQQIETFKRENELAPDGAADNGDGAPGVDFDDEIDLRAEDDALIAAELEAEQARKAEEAAAAALKAAEEAAAKAAAGEDPDADDDEAEKPAARRRGRRGRGRRGKAALEGTFDHGEEGYGLWLDPAVEDDPIYAEHWAGHRPVEVTIEADRIIIRRAESADGDDDT